MNHDSISIERKGVEVLRRLRALAQKDRQHEVAPHACRAPIPSVSRSSDDGAARPGAYRKPAVRCSLKVARSEYAPSFLARDTHARNQTSLRLSVPETCSSCATTTRRLATKHLRIRVMRENQMH